MARHPARGVQHGAVAAHGHNQIHPGRKLGFRDTIPFIQFSGHIVVGAQQHLAAAVAQMGGDDGNRLGHVGVGEPAQQSYALEGFGHDVARSWQHDCT